MKSLDFGRYALSSCVIAAMLAACGGPQPPIGTSSAIPQDAVNSTQVVQQRSAPPSYEILTSFYGRRGIEPLGLTVASRHDAFYGMTMDGGRYNKGTFFKLTLSGDESVLHNLNSGYGNPPSVLTPLDGLLYGTLNQQGSCGDNNCGGAVFSLTHSGRMQILHAFSQANPRDGVAPVSLTVLNGTLYGVAEGAVTNRAVIMGRGALKSSV